MDTLLIGTYTRHTSNGIYQTKLDSENSSFEKLSLLARTENPTYLDYDPNTETVFSVCQKGTSGGIALWSYKNDNLELIRQELSPGAAPCYIFYDHAQDLIYDANYHLGSVNIYNQEGQIKFFQYPKGAHAHFAALNPRNQILYTVDLGHGAIIKYKDLSEIAVYHTAKDAGPRHLAFHPFLDCIYVINELNCTIEVIEDLEYKMTHSQSVNLIDQADDSSSAAAIRISKDGKFLYASIRGVNHLAVFQVDGRGLLTKIQSISTEGDHPRDFTFNPGETHIVVANRDSNNLTLFSRDDTTGLLTYTGTSLISPEPVSVLFI